MNRHYLQEITCACFNLQVTPLSENGSCGAGFAVSNRACCTAAAHASPAALAFNTLCSLMLTLSVHVFHLVNPFLLIAVFEGLLGGKRVTEGRLLPRKKMMQPVLAVPLLWSPFGSRAGELLGQRQPAPSCSLRVCFSIVGRWEGGQV